MWPPEAAEPPRRRRRRRRRAPRPSRGRRPEIQGLRALCIAQVLCYHAWGVGSPVGVDVFITISAYLMTGAFLRRAEGGRTPSVVERWVLTFKRLLPPLVVTVIAAVLAALALQPQNRWHGVLWDGLASVTYWQNWRLAALAADYFAEDHSAASPLQHLWSMSMQGQVFLLWPVLMAGCLLLARRAGRGVRSVVALAFALVAAGSLAWLLLAAPAGGAVYFDTRARLWEFALGSAVAAVAPWVRLPPAAARLTAAAGLAVLLLFFGVHLGSYPGPAALGPMLAVSAILVTGQGEGRGRVTELLSARPLMWVGDISYALYLVHWPVFVSYLVATDRQRLGLGSGMLLTVLSLGLAQLLTVLVDRPAQAFPRRGPSLRLQAALVAGSLAVGLLPLLGGQALLERTHAQQVRSAAAEAGSAAHPGARALVPGAPVPTFDGPPIPGPLALSQEWVPGFPEPCSARQTARLAGLRTGCGTLAATRPGARTVLVVGDSHTEQTTVPLVTELARRHGWQATSYLTGGCAFGQVRHYAGPCARRNQAVLDLIAQDRPDVVFLHTTYAVADSPAEELRPGVEPLVRDLTARGITVVGLRDNIRSTRHLYECSSSRPDRGATGGCVLDRTRHLAATDPGRALERIRGYHHLDPTDLYCTGTRCPTVIGNVFVYLDAHHLTATYSRTMAPLLADRVDRLLQLR
ncbi:acyltransferase family protein [Arsenicicoccus dermatophilus]|uniref:acyltransferase family protein n=1 Tax=Arsenicicoccus dermatophilus TaxID=1076331 RepID=UPI0039174836